MFRLSAPIVVFLIASLTAQSADWSLSENPELARYFETEVSRIERDNSLLKFQSLHEWTAAKPQLRQQLFANLGLSPLPQKTPLHVQITGRVDEDEFTVENLHFQSSPGLYVTANLYLPKERSEPVPAVLYVCGHGRVAKDGVSYGNKAHYQHHGAWFARNGYACLTIDTLQLGEIEGIHHGTYRYNRWWWNGRGYTSAGVEAWNCIRALDYLESRPEIDSQRFGVTGRSGGGAYSWWIAALDDRIQCAVPVAGITTLRNHVVDGCVEGHCDCMYMVNTSRWDYATVAALVAPRPLLISNTDKDRIFPLDGVVAVHSQVRHIYDLYEKPGQLGLHITEGPHRDTQELRVHAFRWLNRWLKQDEDLIETTAQKMFEPEQLRVFHELPKDERNTTIDDDFVPAVPPMDQSRRERILSDQTTWIDLSLQSLRNQCFAAWPDRDPMWQPDNSVRVTSIAEPANSTPQKKNLSLQRLHFNSQQHVPLFMDLLTHKSNNSDLKSLKSVQVFITDDARWEQCEQLISGDADVDASDRIPIVPLLLKHVEKPGSAVVVFCPRGAGAHRWNGDDKKQIQIRRRFQLIGTTADAMRVWDIRRAMQVLRSECSGLVDLHLAAAGGTIELGLIASLFEPPVTSIRIDSLPTSREERPVILNQDRTLHQEELLALAAHRNSLVLNETICDQYEQILNLSSNGQWTGEHIRKQLQPTEEGSARPAQGR